MKDDDPSLRIRFFEALIMNAIGVKQNFSYAGPDADCLKELVIVETDGEICLEPEYSEIDRFGFGNEYRLGSNLFDDDFTFNAVQDRLQSVIADKRLGTLPEDCKLCRFRTVCRGSHPGSRYDDADGSYQHRSAYCSAMQMLCAEIVRSLATFGYEDQLIDERLRSTPDRSGVAAGECVV